MTDAEYRERVFRRVSRGNPQKDVKVYRNAIQATKNDALGQFALKSIGTGWGTLMEFDYSLAITGSHAAFSGTDILPDSIVPIDNVTHPSVLNGGRLLRFIPVSNGDTDFEVRVPHTPFAFYSVTLSGVDFSYSVDLTDNLTVRAIKIPTILTVPAQKSAEAMLIDIGVEYATALLLKKENE